MRARFFWLSAWCCLVLAWLAGCDWEPVARPVKPERVLEGPIRLEYMLDLQGRYLLVSTPNEDDDAPTPRAFSIVDWKTAERCALPTNVARYIPPIFGPTKQRKKAPLFVLPVALQEEEGQVLQFFDEHCKLRGKSEFGRVGSSMQTVPLDEDGREVILYGNGMGVVAIADPWRDEHIPIAETVRRYSFVQRASMLSSPQLLWLVEDGKLTQRSLDGTLLLTMGDSVTDFSQVLFGELRIAFVDDGDMYEAIGPDFVPTRLAESACQPVYRGNMLELWRPCAERQLVRINLMTGEPTEFEKGVFESYTDSGFVFERSRDENGGDDHQWIEPVGGERVEIAQPFAGRPLVLDQQRLAGLKDIPVDPKMPKGEKVRWFVIQDLTLRQDMQDVRVLPGISDLFIFNDNRTSSFVWMVQHDVHDSRAFELAEDEEDPTPDCGDGERNDGEECDDRNRTPGDGCSKFCRVEHKIGELALFSERALNLEELKAGGRPPIESVRTGVPERSPIGGQTGVHGYSVETAIPFREPLVIVISDAQPLSSNPRLSRGKLEARLLSGELGSEIAEDVTSYFLVTTPLPGVLYGVEEGDKPGLWFAAL